MKGKSNFLNKSLHFNFDLFDNDVSFSGDSDSEFFDADNSLLFNFEGLNNEPFAPVKCKVLKFDVELNIEFSGSCFNFKFPFNSEVPAGQLSFLLDSDSGNVDVAIHFDSENGDFKFSSFSEFESKLFKMDSVVFNLDGVINIELNYEFVDHNLKSDCQFISLVLDVGLEFKNESSNHLFVFNSKGVFEISIIGKDINCQVIDDEDLLESEGFDLDVNFNFNVVDDSLVSKIAGNSPFFNSNDPELFFVVHQ